MTRLNINIGFTAHLKDDVYLNRIKLIQLINLSKILVLLRSNLKQQN